MKNEKEKQGRLLCEISGWGGHMQNHVMCLTGIISTWIPFTDLREKQSQRGTVTDRTPKKSSCTCHWQEESYTYMWTRLDFSPNSFVCWWKLQITVTREFQGPHLWLRHATSQGSWVFGVIAGWGAWRLWGQPQIMQTNLITQVRRASFFSVEVCNNNMKFRRYLCSQLYHQCMEFVSKA